MKTWIHVSVIRNSTGELIEQGDFRSQARAQQYFDMRMATGDFGPDQEYDLIMEDISNQFTQRYKIERRKLAREFCLGIIDHIAAVNDDLGESVPLGDLFASPAYQGIILALLTGATQTARNAIAALPNEIYQPEIIEAITSKMDAFLVSMTESELPDEEDPEPEPEVE